MSTPSVIPLAHGVGVPAAEVRFQASRASGPGGQHVNTTSSRIELRVAVTAIQGLDDAGRDRLRQLAGRRLIDDAVVLIACAQRAQSANRAAALARLAELVAAARLVPKSRKTSRPSRASQERRLAGKRQQSLAKQRRNVPRNLNQ